LASTQFVLAGNAGGVKSEALAAMTVAGDIGSVGITALAGNIGSIKTSRSLFSTAVNAADIGGLGNVGSITASKVTTITLLARSLSKMSVVLNAAAGLLGEVTSAILRLTGNVGGVGLGTFSAAGPVASSSWFSLGGNVTKVTSARTIGSSSLIVSDPAFGKLGTLQAASFSGVVARARTIDAINASGAKEVAPASPLIVGNIVGGVIHAYDETGTVASIKTLSTAGSFDSSSVQAERGIGTLKVGRALNASTVVADDALVGNANVGRINSFNAGAITSSTLSAQTLGASKITGYATPDLTPGSKVFGDIVTSTINVAGATPTKPVGVASLSVQRSLNSALLKAPGGITTVTIGANVETSTINLDNPVNPAAGFLTTLTSSDFNNSTVRAGTGGNWSINAASAFQREGRVLGGKFVVLANATAASGTKVLGTLKIASDYFSSAIVDVPASVGTVTINGLISTASNINAGYATGARLENLNVGVWGSPNDTVGSRLSTQSVGTFAVKGNAARGFTGSVRLGFFDILGYNAGVGIGKFTASGNVTDSTFRVSDGDVTSFVVQRFEDSSLLVGFRPVKDNDLTATATAANWSATNRKIGLFQTTAPFNVTDVDNSSSFRNSNVFAAILGTITLSGVDPTEDDTTAFGIGFRASSAAGGTVKINGSATALTSPFVDNEFNYLGLSG
jgi:hypothetical protein